MSILKPGAWAGGIALVLAGIVTVGSTQHGSIAWWASLASIVAGAGILVWGASHHFQRWWRGPTVPEINAALMDFPYQAGALIRGIRWSPGFSHVSVHLSNRSRRSMTDLNLVLTLEKPLIRSTCRSGFAECSIGDAHSPSGQVTIIGKYDDGEPVALVADEENSFSISPSHRLVCARLPPGAQVDLDLATVEPLPAPPFWNFTKCNPTWIAIEGTVTVDGEPQVVTWRQELRSSAGLQD